MNRTERMDRPLGPSLVAAHPPPNRGLPDLPTTSRRINPPVTAIPPLPPVPSSLRKVPSSSNLTVGAPLAATQVISLAREAMRDALKENDHQTADANGTSNELIPGLTIDLSRKNIQRLPEEVVDIIKNELERLALSHNKIASFPARFAECASLRYLNVRNNDIRDFPLPLCELKSLEILDLGRNKLRILPPEMVKLASLKVFSVQKNRIEELPLCLADMTSLQMIKLDGNPIKFPPPEIFQVQAGSPSNEGLLKESEVTEVTVTSYLKKYLKQKAMNGRNESETGGDESSEGTETPRVPLKRVFSGRFPIKVNGTDIGDSRSPAFGRPPPVPSRSHYRGLSQQSTTIRRPGVMPLTIGSVNERLRSNSETLLQTSRADRSMDRSRRMGIVSKKTHELGTLDEMEASNRYSHYRGLSHGSAMYPNGNATANRSPASPAEPLNQRPVYVRRLSILPERRRESKYYDPVYETAKGVLYSIFQIHPMIQMLMSLTSEGAARRSSLEIVVYNTNSHVEELERELSLHDPTMAGGPELGSRENENVHRACITLVNAYAHVCSLLASNVDLFIDNGEPRYIRTLLTQLYNSIMELRVTTSQLSMDSGYRDEGFKKSASRAAIGSAVKVHSRESSMTPSVERLGHGQRGGSRNFVHNPSNLRVATDVALPTAYINGSGRTATITSATPRSGESFSSISSRGMFGEFTEEDAKFEKIFLVLQNSSDLVLHILPTFLVQFQNLLRNAMMQRPSEHVIHAWNALIAKCRTAIQETEMLKDRLSSIKLKEPDARNQGGLWLLCNNFFNSWAEMGMKLKEYAGMIQLPLDTRARLRPIQISVKEAMDLIGASPWSYLVRGSNSGMAVNSYGNRSVQLPISPQSAALGPAMQATVPSTPQSGSFSSAFSGNVFERADKLISMGMHSRAGTFSSTSGSFTSISSALSDDVGYSPSSMLSPGSANGGGSGQLPLRLTNNSSSRVAPRV